MLPFLKKMLPILKKMLPILKKMLPFQLATFWYVVKIRHFRDRVRDQVAEKGNKIGIATNYYGAR